MAKYLIQDIIPPEKTAHNKVSVKIIHHKAPEKPHAQATHRVFEHTTVHHAKKEILEKHVEELEVGDEEPVITADPKAMILDQLNNKDTMSPERIEMKPAQSYFASDPEPEVPVKSWPYKQNEEHASAYVPPSSNMNFSTREAGSGGRSSWMSGWLPWIAGVALVGVALVVGMNYFSGATVTVLPKRGTIPMDQKMTILKSPLNGELSFSVMKVVLEETREVPATGEKAVTAKATGKIVVYNTQSVPQRLIKNTRFQGPTGKIYRINDSITVPKATVKAGKTTPGSFGVTIYADEAGPDFNSVAVDFTVPGLKGSPTFEKVYARSSGPLTGGTSGTIKSVSDLDLKQASDDLRIQLETKLRTKARSDLGPSQIGYDQGMIVELADAALSKAPSSSPDKAVVSQTGTLYFLTMNRDELTRAIVRSLIPSWNGEDVLINNLETIELGLAETSGESLWKSEKLDITLKGTPSLDWKVDEAAIKKVILGAPKDSFNAILAQFPTIDRAKATIHPVWKRSFPTKEKDIIVEVVDAMPK